MYPDRNGSTMVKKRNYSRNKALTSIVTLGIIVSSPSCITSYLMTQPITSSYHFINIIPKSSSTKKCIFPNYRCLPLAVLTAPDKLEEALLSAISEYDEVNSIETN